MKAITFFLCPHVVFSWLIDVEGCESVKKPKIDVENMQNYNNHFEAHSSSTPSRPFHLTMTRQYLYLLGITLVPRRPALSWLTLYLCFCYKRSSKTRLDVLGFCRQYLDLISGHSLPMGYRTSPWSSQVWTWLSSSWPLNDPNKIIPIVRDHSQ